MKSNITSNSWFSEQMLKVEIGNKIIKSELNQISYFALSLMR